MTRTLEIPFPPQRQPGFRARLEPPFVPIDPRWEYKAIVRTAEQGLLSEPELNAMGANTGS